VLAGSGLWYFADRGSSAPQGVVNLYQAFCVEAFHKAELCFEVRDLHGFSIFIVAQSVEDMGQWMGAITAASKRRPSDEPHDLAMRSWCKNMASADRVSGAMEAGSEGQVHSSISWQALAYGREDQASSSSSDDDDDHKHSDRGNTGGLLPPEPEEPCSSSPPRQQLVTDNSTMGSLTDSSMDLLGGPGPQRHPKADLVAAQNLPESEFEDLCAEWLADGPLDGGSQVAKGPTAPTPRSAALLADI